MKNTLSKIFIILLMLFNISFSQEYGTIFTQKEADEQFGEVLENFEVSLKTMEKFLSETENVIMFKLEKDNLVILGDSRKLIYSTSGFEDKNEVFRVFNVSKVKELLNLGKEEKIFIENRKEVLSISNGSKTLERGLPCPPFCD